MPKPNPTAKMSRFLRNWRPAIALRLWSSTCVRAIWVMSNSWDHEKVPGKDQIVEIRAVDGRLHVARKAKHPDEWEPPYEPYDTYGPGETYETSEFNTDDEADASSVTE